uniref:Uncharacterized protein n=1 Tax=Molossus molossus TaxID=27622 RepID=A0A7J8FSM9_MOLMO|nr:hypothetical protein HJG59_008313 [Molossus molossus]
MPKLGLPNSPAPSRLFTNVFSDLSSTYINSLGNLNSFYSFTNTAILTVPQIIFLRPKTSYLHPTALFKRKQKRFFINFFFSEKGGERNIYVREKHLSSASCMPSTGDLAHNLGMCPEWESNRCPLGALVEPNHWAPIGLCNQSSL